mmetsp:Transcript_71784/g.156269  ORF Transcript_71784/g.156269 Transcript_71784/m.156269 type:complete len:109 (+) Transcript_71784:91-417(+)
MNQIAGQRHNNNNTNECDLVKTRTGQQVDKRRDVHYLIFPISNSGSYSFSKPSQGRRRVHQKRLKFLFGADATEHRLARKIGCVALLSQLLRGHSSALGLRLPAAKGL